MFDHVSSKVTHQHITDDSNSGSDVFCPFFVDFVCCLFCFDKTVLRMTEKLVWFCELFRCFDAVLFLFPTCKTLNEELYTY